MKKTYLLSYKTEKFQALNSSGLTFILNLQTVWFWGLIVKWHTTKYVVPDRSPLKPYTDNWDKLISDRKPLK